MPTAKHTFTLQGNLIKERLVLDEVKLIVIESTTIPSFNYNSMTEENLRRTLGEQTSREVEETFPDFITKNQHVHFLTNNFSAKIKTEVISEEDRKSHFINNTGRMDTFFARYPGSQGTLAFSRVGFSPRKDKALVYVIAHQDFSVQLDPLWMPGSTYFALLTKAKEGWKIQRVYHPNRAARDSLPEKPLTVNLAQCAAASRNLAWGLGSERVEIKGRRRDQCVLEHFSEIEGSGSISECRLPISLREVTIYNAGISFRYSLDVSKHCSVIKRGSLIDRWRPQ